MKILLLIFCFTSVHFVAFDQTSADTSRHLSFKGVPIDGTLEKFAAKIKQSGFTHLSTKDGMAMFQGDFAGYKECYVGVSTLKQKDLVYKIGVVFPERETWSLLSGNYFDLKQMLIQKYGEPSEVVEKFESRVEPPDDNAKMYEVKFDRCKYISTWETVKGDIQLSIGHNGVTNCFITLAYFDKINSATIKSKAIDDL